MLSLNLTGGEGDREGGSTEQGHSQEWETVGILLLLPFPFPPAPPAPHL